MNSFFFLSFFMLPQFVVSFGENKVTNRQARAISMHYIIPVVGADSSITNVEQKYQKYFLDDFIMYRFYYSYSSNLSGKNLLQEERFRYFVFHKDSTQGWLYDPNPVHSIPDGRYPVDSVFKINSIKNDRVDILSATRPDSVFYLENGDKVKRYKPLPDSAQPEPYTLRFYYTKGLQGINEQLSVKMDNEPGMKLYRISITSDGWYYERYKMKFPAREYLMEIRELPPEKNPEVLNYFDQYINNQQR
jgi:hypothetical protein